MMSTIEMRARLLPPALAALVFLGGCAPRTKTLDIYVPRSTNPAGGESVTIVSVSDARSVVSEVDSGDRTFAELASGAGGFVVLPEGRTVAEVVEKAVAEGLRRAGYRVVARGAPEASEVVPIEIEVRRFWAWKEATWPEGKTGTYFSAKILLKGPVAPFAASRTIIVDIKDRPKGYATLWLLRLDTFNGAMKKGTKRLIEEVAAAASSSESS